MCDQTCLSSFTFCLDFSILCSQCVSISYDSTLEEAQWNYWRDKPYRMTNEELEEALEKSRVEAKDVVDIMDGYSINSLEIVLNTFVWRRYCITRLWVPAWRHACVHCATTLGSRRRAHSIQTERDDYRRHTRWFVPTNGGRDSVPWSSDSGMSSTSAREQLGGSRSDTLSVSAGYRTKSRETPTRRISGDGGRRMIPNHGTSRVRGYSSAMRAIPPRLVIQASQPSSDRSMS